MTRAKLIDCDDWQGLYVDGELEAQGSEICGTDPFYLVEVATKYELVRADFSIYYIENEDDLGNLYGFGSLPKNLSDMCGDYG